MRKVIYRMSVSLDGYIEAPNGDIDWSAPDPELHRHFNELERQTGAMLYGRGLYENMTAFWPTADQDPAASEPVKEYARIWREKPKVVFSTTLKHVQWNSRLASGNIDEEVRWLKEQPGGDLTVGGAGLAASLMQLGLIDEYWLYTHPIILGGGKKMIGPLQQRIKLRLVETRTFPGGVVMLRYGVRSSG